MSWALRPLTREERPLWEELAREAPSATVFHLPLWSDVLAEVFDAQSVPFAVERDGEIVGVWPVLLTRMAGLRIAASFLRGWASPYGGPILVHSGADVNFHLLVEQLRRHLQCHYVEMTLSGTSDARSVGLQQYETELRRTIVLGLEKDPDVVWKRITGKCRNMIRKAQRSEVEVEEVRDPEFVEAYWDMAMQTWRKAGRKPGIPLRFYRAALRALQPRGVAKVLAARRRGELLSAAIVLCNGDRYYYWDGVSYPSANRYASNNLVQWRAIQMACEAGGVLYDFLGANDPGIARFKRSFGGEDREYLYVYRPYGLRARLGRFAYKNLYRPLRRRWA